MILAHADDAAETRVPVQIRVAVGGLVGETAWHIALGDGVDRLIAVLDEEDVILRDPVGTATVFVDPAADTERARQDILFLTAVTLTDQRRASILVRPGLQPVQPAGAELGLEQADPLADDGVGGDGRGPAAAGHRFAGLQVGSGHRCFFIHPCVVQPSSISNSKRASPARRPSFSTSSAI